MFGAIHLRTVKNRNILLRLSEESYSLSLLWKLGLVLEAFKFRNTVPRVNQARGARECSILQGQPIRVPMVLDNTSS